MSRTALLAGATGLVGAALLQQLLASSDYTRVIVLSRRALLLDSNKLAVIESTLEDLESLGTRIAADDVFCCLGTTTAKAGGNAGLERVDYHLVVALARTTRAQGATQFLVVSAAGASPTSPAFYPRVKARMEETVATIGFATAHIFRPSLLLGARSESRPAEAFAQKLSPLLAPFCVGPLRKYQPIKAEDVASAMLKLALLPAQGVHIHDLPL